LKAHPAVPHELRQVRELNLCVDLALLNVDVTRVLAEVFEGDALERHWELPVAHACLTPTSYLTLGNTRLIVVIRSKWRS
jgi:uncharacterized protein YdiU (UPF0061 family)